MSEQRTSEKLVPSPYDGKWCHENYSEASKLINRLLRREHYARKLLEPLAEYYPEIRSWLDYPLL